MKCCVCDEGELVTEQDIHENRLLDGTVIRVMGYWRQYCDYCGTIQVTPEISRLNKQISLQNNKS